MVVYSYDSSVPGTSSRKPAAGSRFVAVDAEGCAGPHADPHTGVSPTFFYLQLDNTAYHPVAPAKEPSLHDTVLASGHCARGWITFEIPRMAKPQAVIFHSTEVVAWRLPR